MIVKVIQIISSMVRLFGIKLSRNSFVIYVIVVCNMLTETLKVKVKVYALLKWQDLHMFLDCLA